MTKGTRQLPHSAHRRAAIRRWLDGHAATAVRIRQAFSEEGPNPAQAVAEALSAANALAAMGVWPGPRDPASEAAVLVVRERWARIQRKAKRDWLARQAAREERGTRA